LNELSITINDIDRVNILNELGNEFVYEDKNLAELYYQQGLQLANEILFQGLEEDHEVLSVKSKILSGLGFVSYLNQNYSKAILEIEECIVLNNSLNNGALEEGGKFLLYLSYCYFKLNDFQSSIECLKESLVLSNGNMEVTARIHYLLSKNYQRIGSLDKAISHLNECLGICQENNFFYNQIVVINSLITIAQKKGNWKKSKKLLSSVKSLIDKNDNYSITGYYALLGNSYMHDGNLDSAKICLEKGEQMSELEKSVEQRFVNNLVKVYEYRAELEILLKNYERALIYADKIFASGNKHNSILELMSSHKLRYRIYEENQEYEKAFIALKAYNEIKEKNKIADIKGKLLKQEFELQVSQKKIEDSIAYQIIVQKRIAELKNHEVIIEEERKTKYLLIGSLIVSILAFFIFFRGLRRKRKDNEIIIAQNNASDVNQKLLESQNKKLQSKATLYKILQICSTDVGIKTILNETLNQLLDTVIIGGNGKGYVLLEKEIRINSIEVYTGLSDLEIEKLKNTPFDSCICGAVYSNHKVELCTKELELNHFNIPIVHNFEVLGVVVVETVLKENEMNNSIEFLNSVSILLGETIFRHNTADKLRIAHIENTLRKKEVEKVNEKVNLALEKQEAINSLMNAIINNENIGGKVYDYVLSIFGVVILKRLNITLFDFEKNLVELYFLKENGEDSMDNKPFPLSEFSDETISQLMVNSTVIVESIKNKKIKSISDIEMMRLNINSFVCYPLMSDNNLLGSLNISFEKSFKFTDKQNEFLKMLVEGITIAIRQNLMFNKIVFANTEMTKLQYELNSSLNYSKEIQKAILPTKEVFDSTFPKHFSILKQKDTVGGDFYWVRNYKDVKMVACVDCTGHNVPGAFMTMLARVLLREAGTIKAIRGPGKILKQMDSAIRNILKQKDYVGMQDGMDMTICVIDNQNNKIEFASAQRPIVVQEKGKQELTVLKGSKFPVGGFSKEEKTYDVIKFDLDQIEKFYMFSDGYVDQFGGPKVKKIGTKKFISNLNLIKNLSMDKQKEFLVNEIENWKGDLNQIDDICVIGIDLT